MIQPLIDEQQLADDLAGETSAFSVDLGACPAVAVKDDVEALIGRAKASLNLNVADHANVTGLLFQARRQ